MAAQDFRHAIQLEDEPVADYIRRLEQTFRMAYGRDGMSVETRETLLYGQLQEGLKYELMKAAAVSGAQGYKQLCLAARNEEKWLIDLKKRRQFLKPQPQSMERKASTRMQKNQQTSQPHNNSSVGDGSGKRCYNCGRMGHVAKDCRAPKVDGRSQGPERRWTYEAITRQPDRGPPSKSE